MNGHDKRAAETLTSMPSSPKDREAIRFALLEKYSAWHEEPTDLSCELARIEEIKNSTADLLTRLEAITRDLSRKTHREL